MRHNDRQSDFFWGALVGGTLATLGVMLFTTKKGKQLQRCVADAYDNVKDTVIQAKDQVEEKAYEAKESLIHAKDHLGEKAKQAKDALVDAKDHAGEKVKEALDSAEDQGKKALHKAKHEIHHK